MMYCKIVKGENFTNRYPNPTDVYRVANYVLNNVKANHGICGSNLMIVNEDVLHTNVQFLARQFLTVQGTMDGCSRRLYHLIVSFDPETSRLLRLSQVKRIGDWVLDMYRPYQSLYVLHEDKEHAHIHFLFNNLPVDDNNPALSNFLYIANVENMIDSYLSECIYKIPQSTRLIQR